MDVANRIAIARIRKTDALIEAIQALDTETPITWDELTRVEPSWWQGLAKMAGVKPPSPETIKLVITTLERRDNPPDVFARFKD